MGSNVVTFSDWLVSGCQSEWLARAMAVRGVGANTLQHGQLLHSDAMLERMHYVDDAEGTHAALQSHCSNVDCPQRRLIFKGQGSRAQRGPFFVLHESQ